MTPYRYLEFNVDGSKLTKKTGCNFSHITKSSINYLVTKFYFSEEWKDASKVVSFWIGETEYPVLMHDNQSFVPYSVADVDKFYISVTMRAKDKNNNTIQVTTNKFKIKQEVD